MSICNPGDERFCHYRGYCSRNKDRCVCYDDNVYDYTLNCNIYLTNTPTSLPTTPQVVIPQSASISTQSVQSNVLLVSLSVVGSVICIILSFGLLKLVKSINPRWSDKLSIQKLGKDNKRIHKPAPLAIKKLGREKTCTHKPALFPIKKLSTLTQARALAFIKKNSGSFSSFMWLDDGRGSFP
jgi:hypothetical protein